MATHVCSASELLSVASDFRNRSSFELAVIRTSLLCQILQEANPMADCSTSTLLQSFGCCTNLSIWQLEAIQAQLLCEILHAGGGGGQSCLTCSINTDPVDEPTCDCAMHYRKDNSTIWYWDGEAMQWFLFG